jgi:hypothetical protein
VNGEGLATGVETHLASFVTYPLEPHPFPPPTAAKNKRRNDAAGRALPTYWRPISPLCPRTRIFRVEDATGPHSGIFFVTILKKNLVASTPVRKSRAVPFALAEVAPKFSH